MKKPTFLFLVIERHCISWRTDHDHTGSDPYTGDPFTKAAEIMGRFFRDYKITQFQLRDERK